MNKGITKVTLRESHRDQSTESINVQIVKCKGYFVLVDVI